MEEKRKFPRLEKSLSLKLSDSDEEFDILTETKNISASGAYCRVDRPLEVMTRLKMIILVPLKRNQSRSVKKINCLGVVVRLVVAGDDIKYPYYIGIYFSDLKERDQKILRSYVDSCLKQ